MLKYLQIKWQRIWVLLHDNTVRKWVGLWVKRDLSWINNRCIRVVGRGEVYYYIVFPTVSVWTFFIIKSKDDRDKVWGENVLSRGCQLWWRPRGWCEFGEFEEAIGAGAWCMKARKGRRVVGEQEVSDHAGPRGQRAVWGFPPAAKEAIREAWAGGAGIWSSPLKGPSDWTRDLYT